MTVKTVVNYTTEEIYSMINVLTFLSDMLDSDTATTEMKERANTAFEDIAELLCLDKEGKDTFEREGW